MSTRHLTLTAMLTALCCILGPLTLPIGPVPLSMTTALLMGMALLLGTKHATLCCGVYLALGLLGMPVFSGFTGGVGALLGPTGGFLLGYLPMTAWCGFLFGRTSNRRLQAAACISATMLLYLCGASWYVWQTSTSLLSALTVCVLPFLPGDAVKIILVVTFGNSLNTRLKKTGLI